MLWTPPPPKIAEKLNLSIDVSLSKKSLYILNFFLQSENSITRHSSGLAVTQTPALIENSASVTQQSVPVFRQPTGVPIPYYPSNYMPYGPYFHPFYLSNHHVPPFIGNANFPQQHPISSSYPSATTAASHVKYPVSQYKTGSNGTHPIHVGITTGYEMFNPNANIANLAENSELSNSQLKDNNVHLSGQQVVFFSYIRFQFWYCVQIFFITYTFLNMLVNQSLQLNKFPSAIKWSWDMHVLF